VNAKLMDNRNGHRAKRAASGALLPGGLVNDRGIR
jgi:hypothetical protein